MDDKTTRLSDREMVRRALLDAVSWQESLADAYSGMTDDPMCIEARATAARYRAILRRRYGDDRNGIERALEGAREITLAELREMADGQK